MVFEEGKPQSLRVDPSAFLKLCPGHPAHTAATQEEHLPNDQRYSLMCLRQRMQAHFDAEISAFYTKHSDIRLEYDFTIDAFLQKKEEED
jgi:hypothetical protein